MSLESVHVTTFDLVNKPEYDGIVGGRFIYEDVCEKVRDVAIEWLKRRFENLRGKARICGVGVFEQARVLKLDLEFDPGTKDRFREFRLALHSHLCLACGTEYTLYRDPAWDRQLSPHITVAYCSIRFHGKKPVP